MEYENDVEKNESTYWLFFELLWRDFFKYVSMQHRNKFFSKDGIYGNEKEWSHAHRRCTHGRGVRRVGGSPGVDWT